jgi:hypothetical protein
VEKEYKSKQLRCIECNSEFTIDPTEQKFYDETIATDPITGVKAPMKQPKRCSQCRQKRKIERLKREAQNAPVKINRNSPFAKFLPKMDDGFDGKLMP